jgi:hypothetical protein
MANNYDKSVVDFERTDIKRERERERESETTGTQIRLHAGRSKRTNFINGF